MKGIEVRIPQVMNNDDALGTDNPTRFVGNGGAVELWQDGERILELVWWERDSVDLDTLQTVPEVNARVAHAGEIHFGVSSLRRKS